METGSADVCAVSQEDSGTSRLIPNAVTGNVGFMRAILVKWAANKTIAVPIDICPFMSNLFDPCPLLHLLCVPQTNEASATVQPQNKTTVAIEVHLVECAGD